MYAHELHCIYDGEYSWRCEDCGATAKGKDITTHDCSMFLGFKLAEMEKKYNVMLQQMKDSHIRHVTTLRCIYALNEKCVNLDKRMDLIVNTTNQLLKRKCMPKPKANYCTFSDLLLIDEDSDEKEENKQVKKEDDKPATTVNVTQNGLSMPVRMKIWTWKELEARRVREFAETNNYVLEAFCYHARKGLRIGARGGFKADSDAPPIPRSAQTCTSSSRIGSTAAEDAREISNTLMRSAPEAHIEEDNTEIQDVEVEVVDVEDNEEEGYDTVN
jgi:hypothetical protein